MNLIDYSFINNIEFGVYSEKTNIHQPESIFESAVKSALVLLKRKVIQFLLKDLNMKRNQYL